MLLIFYPSSVCVALGVFFSLLRCIPGPVAFGELNQSVKNYFLACRRSTNWEGQYERLELALSLTFTSSFALNDEMFDVLYIDLSLVLYALEKRRCY